MTYLDEVHAVGLYGPRGGGIAERDGVMHRPTAIQGTLGKAVRRDGRLYRRLGGTVDFLRSHAPGLHLHDVAAAGARRRRARRVRHLKSSQVERDRHQERAATVKRRLAEAGLPVMPSREPHRAGRGRRSAALQGRLRRAAARAPASMSSRSTTRPSRAAPSACA